MSWTDVFKQQAATTTMQASFGAPTKEAIKAQQQVTLSTYQGPGREKVLAWLEKRGHVPNGVADAARGGSTPIDIGKAVHNAWQQQLAGGVVEGGAGTVGRKAVESGGQLVNDAVEYGGALATRTSANPVYGGLIGQMMQGRGFAPFADPAAQAAAAPQRVAEVLSDAAEYAPEVIAPGGSAAAEVAAESPELRNFVTNALTYIGTAENRSSVLMNTVESMTAAGHLDGIDAILAREISLAPAEHSAPALMEALERSEAPIAAAAEAGPAAVHAIAEAVTGASHVAPEAIQVATEVAHAAPEAMKVAATVAHDLHPNALAAFSESLTGAMKLIHF